jgi:hypothetical protein
MNFPKGFSSHTNLMGHKITGCLLVKLFTLHTTAFKKIFPTKTPPMPKAKSMKPKASITKLKASNMKPKARDTKSRAGNMKLKAKKGASKGKALAKKSIPTQPHHNLRFKNHITDWILAVSSLL